MTESPNTPLQQSTSEQNPASLVGQIINDLQQVVELQFRLTQSNVESGLKRVSVALSIMALGGCLLGLFAILASMSLVHLLHWVASPMGDPSGGLPTGGFPLWVCFAITACGMAIIGSAMILIGIGQYRKCCRRWLANTQ